MGRIGRLTITEVRLLSLTLSFLAQVCVSPVTLSLPLRDAKPRLARLSHYIRPVPPPPSPTSQGHLWPRVSWGWDVELLARAGGDLLCARQPFVPWAFRDFPSRGRGTGHCSGFSSLAGTPRPRQPAPFFRQPGPRSPREEALGATSIAAAGAPGSPDSSPSRPSRDSAFLAVGQEQTCRRPPATLPDTPPTPGARGRAAGERSDERWRRGGRRGRKKINHRATLTYQLPGHLGALLGHGPLGAGNVAGPTLIYGPHPPPTLSVS